MEGELEEVLDTLSDTKPEVLELAEGVLEGEEDEEALFDIMPEVLPDAVMVSEEVLETLADSDADIEFCEE